MLPIRLKIKGFLSYRDEAEFDFDGRSLWMLCGENGAGKSSVFDAMTFALYKQHRGGSQNAKDLINWASDGFRIEFEFAIARERYRAVRTIERNGGATRLLSRWDNGRWVNLDNSQMDDDFATHVRQILGMDFRTFTRSVILEQGKVDRILGDNPTDRFNMLSQIVDLSAYRDLHERTVTLEREHTDDVRAFERQLSLLSKVDPNDIASLRTEIDQLTVRAETTAQQVKDLTVLAVHAKRWEVATARLTDVEKEITEGEVRISDADRIRSGAARHDELNLVLPLLTEWQRTKRELQEAKDEYARAIETRNLKFHAVATALNREFTADTALLIQEADIHIESLKEIKNAIPRLKALIFRRQKAADALSKGTVLWMAAVTAPPEKEVFTHTEQQIVTGYESNKNDISTRLKIAVNQRQDVQSRQKRFTEAGDDATCRYCGQALTPDARVETERQLQSELAEIALSIDTLTAESQVVEERLKSARESLKQKETEWKNLDKAKQAYDIDMRQTESDLITATEEYQRESGELPSYMTARLMLPSNTQDTAWVDQTHFPTNSDVSGYEERAKAIPSLTTERQTLQNAEQAVKLISTKLAERNLAVDRAVERIPIKWHDAGLTNENIQKYTDERDTLNDALFELKALETAEQNQKDRIDERTRLQAEVEAIPSAARRSSSLISEEIKQVEAEATEAQNTLIASRSRLQTLTDAQYQIRVLTEGRNKSAKEQDIYGQLATLLDREHLQRYLLRGAEEAIVAYANDALRSFSHGSMYLAQRPEGEGRRGRDTAFDLVCHNTETSDGPLPLSNLSGSQKFRVAVSLAIGLGRFASSDSSRIQSVIIDEGFGSLDIRGQQEMATELKKLTEKLERIIVVSHQETFFDAFPDRYQIRLEDGSSKNERIVA